MFHGCTDHGGYQHHSITPNPVETHSNLANPLEGRTILTLLATRNRPLTPSTTLNITARINAFPSDRLAQAHRHVAGVTCLQSRRAERSRVVAERELEGSSRGETGDAVGGGGDAVRGAAELCARVAGCEGSVPGLAIKLRTYQSCRLFRVEYSRRYRRGSSWRDKDTSRLDH
jgi:hypothetical protein